MKKQKNTRTVIIFLVFLAILFGLLSFAVAKELSTTKIRSTQATSYKTYTSITGSGLTVTYPSSWSIFPAEEVKKSQAGGTFAATLLISQKSTSKDGHPEVPNDHVCVSLTEMAGPWPYRFMPPSDITTRSDFSLGSTTVALAEPTSPARGNFDAQLINIAPKGPHGPSYIPLKNGYYLLAIAQKGCYPAEHLAHRDISVDAEQARTILKSLTLTQKQSNFSGPLFWHEVFCYNSYTVRPGSSVG